MHERHPIFLLHTTNLSTRTHDKKNISTRTHNSTFLSCYFALHDLIFEVAPLVVGRRERHDAGLGTVGDGVVIDVVDGCIGGRAQGSAHTPLLPHQHLHPRAVGDLDRAPWLLAVAARLLRGGSSSSVLMSCSHSGFVMPMRWRAGRCGDGGAPVACAVWRSSAASSRGRFICVCVCVCVCVRVCVYHDEHELVSHHLVEVRALLRPDPREVVEAALGACL